jgi:hypothetical protein
MLWTIYKLPAPAAKRYIAAGEDLECLETRLIGILPVIGDQFIVAEQGLAIINDEIIRKFGLCKGCFQTLRRDRSEEDLRPVSQ